jgi:hypothetical protein
MASREVKSYVYKNTGDEQNIKGIGRVGAGETITVPYEEVSHPDLELVETITSQEEIEDKPSKKGK